MPAFFPDRIWRRIKNPTTSNNVTPIAIPDRGTGGVVSKVNGGVDTPEIWATAVVLKNMRSSIPERM